MKVVAESTVGGGLELLPLTRTCSMLKARGGIEGLLAFVPNVNIPSRNELYVVRITGCFWSPPQVIPHIMNVVVMFDAGMSYILNSSEDLLEVCRFQLS